MSKRIKFGTDVKAITAKVVALDFEDCQTEDGTPTPDGKAKMILAYDQNIAVGCCEVIVKYVDKEKPQSSGIEFTENDIINVIEAFRANDSCFDYNKGVALETLELTEYECPHTYYDDLMLYSVLEHMPKLLKENDTLKAQLVEAQKQLEDLRAAARKLIDDIENNYGFHMNSSSTKQQVAKLLEKI